MLDCAHNPHALSWLLARIAEPAVVVFGCLHDKPLTKMLALLPLGAELLACAPDSPRARSAAVVIAAARKLGRRGRACDSVAEHQVMQCQTARLQHPPRRARQSPSPSSTAATHRSPTPTSASPIHQPWQFVTSS